MAGSGHSRGMVPNMGDTAQGAPQLSGAEGPQGNAHTRCSWLVVPSHGWLWPLESRGAIFLVFPCLWLGWGGCMGLPWLGATSGG